MLESFGARLRQRRERQQITLAAIAEQTKIKLSLLEGLERDDVSHWPTGIFRRAFIRTYAHAIGLEPDVVVREFIALYPDPADDGATIEPVNDAGADGTPAGVRPPMRLRYLVGSAMGSLPWFRSDAAQTQAAAAPAPSFTNDDPQAVDSAPAEDVALAAEAGPIAEPTVIKPPAPEPDLLAAAHVCTELGRVDSPGEMAPLLKEVVRILGAVGLIVWVWDPQAAALRAALAHGYSDKVLAQLPAVKRDADNATADAFRSAQTRAVGGHERASGALAVPLMTATGCVGVLAIELHDGREQLGSVRALVTIFAAQLAAWMGAAAQAVQMETSDRRLA